MDRYRLVFLVVSGLYGGTFQEDMLGLGVFVFKHVVCIKDLYSDIYRDKLDHRNLCCLQASTQTAQILF